GDGPPARHGANAQPAGLAQRADLLGQVLVRVVDDPRATGLERHPGRDELRVVDVVRVRTLAPECAQRSCQARGEPGDPGPDAGHTDRADTHVTADVGLRYRRGERHLVAVAGERAALLEEDPDVVGRVQRRRVHDPHGRASLGGFARRHGYPRSVCGIAGTAGERPDPRLLERMALTMQKRGPDGQGIWHDEVVGLASRRLAIIDLHERSNQPLHLGSLHLVFNGELYNYRELRKELEELGHAFETEGDGEVLLHAWSEWRDAALDRFNGMFALSLWDAADRRLVLASD